MQATNANFKDVVTLLGQMECLKKKKKKKKKKRLINIEDGGTVGAETGSVTICSR